MERDVMHPVPLVISLPDGKQAVLCEGRQPGDKPVYAVDGVPTDIDVSIPPDLVETGWYWSGSFLYQPWPERADGPGVAITTALYGPPGYADDRGTCWDAARRLDAKRIEVRQALAASKPKKSKKAASIQPAAKRAEADAELSSNFAQMELAL